MKEDVGKLGIYIKTNSKPKKAQEHDWDGALL